jgi:hypothetical protein
MTIRTAPGRPARVSRACLCAGATIVAALWTAPAFAQANDDLLAPLVQPSTDDLLTPLVPPSDDDLLAPLAPEDSGTDDDLLTPLVPADDDLLAPLVPANALEVELLEPLLHPNDPYVARAESEDELITKGAKTIGSMEETAGALGHALQWADRELARAMKGKLSDEEMKKALAAVKKLDGMDDVGTSQPRPGQKPLPLEIDVAEELEWQRKAEASDGTLVLVEKPIEVRQCTAAGVCTRKLKMHYALQPASMDVSPP